MRKFISRYHGDRTENFNVSIAQALLHLQQGWTKSFVEEMKILRERVGSSMTFSATASLSTCHDPMLKCHVLTDLELIAGINNDGTQHLQETLKTLNRRLEVLGSYVSDKQYILGIRRAAMELTRYVAAEPVLIRLLINVGLSIATWKYPPFGLRAPALLERQTPCTNLSTLCYTPRSLAMAPRRSNMPDCCGRKAIAERPFKLSKGLSPVVCSLQEASPSLNRRRTPSHNKTW